METILRVSEVLMQRLAWTSLQATVLIGVVWLLVRYLPRLTPSVRAMLWWLVAAQLLAGLMVSTPLHLPLLPAHVATTAVTTSGAAPAAAPHAVVSVADGGSHPATAIDQHITSPAARLPWQAILAAAWLAAVSLLLALTARGWWRMRGILRRSAKPHDPLLQAICRQRSRALGLRRCPLLRVSEVIDAPQVTGLWRPVILLPGRHRLSHDEAVMAIIHELSHVRRGDLWLGWVPALAQRLFFFHPLVAWAMREYAMHREVACDTEVLRQRSSTPQTYGHLLMRLGITHATPASLSGASPTFRHLKRRLTMLQQTPNLSPHRLRHVALVAGIAVAGIIPYRVTARPTQAAPVPAASTHMHNHTRSGVLPESPTPPSAPPAPPPAPPAPPPAPPMTPPAPPAPPPAVPPAPPAPPAPTLSSGEGGHHFHNVSIDTDHHRQQGFVLIDGDSMQVVGSQDDMQFAKTVAASTHTPTLWLRQGSQRYVTHDPATINRIRKAYAPLTKAAENEGKLAGQEGELAGRESGLAAQEGVLASLQGQLAARQGELAARRAALASQQGNAGAEQRARAASLKAQEAGLHREMARMKARQSAQRKRLDAQRQALAARRKVVAAQREALSKQREQAAKMARRRVHAVLSDALKQGKFTRRD